MTEKELADILRQRQQDMGLSSTSILFLLSDRYIIESYIQCHICGQWLCSYDDALAAAVNSKTYDEWWGQIPHDHLLSHTNSPAANLGARGGKSTLKKYGKKHFQNLSKIANKKRWGKN